MSATDKIVVTGGAGFIGTNLLYMLRKRYPDSRLVSLDIREPGYPVPGAEYEMCDVREPEALTSALSGSTKIFHLAADIGTHESFKNPYDVFTTNVGGTLNVLEFARTMGVEVFLAGMPGVWNNPYSISKDAAVRMARAYFETFGVRVAVLRWYSVYGSYQYLERYQKAVPTFVWAALNNQPLRVYGDGTQVADFIHATDAAHLAIDMLEHEQWGQVVPCASGIGVSANDLAATIIRLCGSSSKIDHLPMRQGEPPQSVVVADTTQLRGVFPNYQLVGLEDGLRMTIDYYRKHPPID